MFIADNAPLGTIRASAILTTGYVAATVLTNTTHGIRRFNQLILDVDFTIGGVTTMELKIEFSSDGVDYYQETFEAITAGNNVESLGQRQFAATGKYRLMLPFNSDFVKVSVKSTGGVVAGSLCSIEAIGAIS